MKKINNKGFTLIELLVVLVILTLILSIALPSITATLERSKDKERSSKEKLVVSEAELYVDRHKNNYTNCGTTTCIIHISDLTNDNPSLKETFKDPANENRTICGYVTYNGTKYAFVESEGDCVLINN